MNVIKPVTVDDTVLLSSTVPETDYAVWNSVTAYAINAYCIMTTGVHRIYQCLVANTNFAPNLNTAGTTPKWLDCGPTNQRAMFDSFVNTRTTGTGTLTVVLQGIRICFWDRIIWVTRISFKHQNIGWRIDGIRYHTKS